MVTPITMEDPTRDEMLAAMQPLLAQHEADQFDMEEAIYWGAADHHGGHGSNLYAALCASPFKPSPKSIEPGETACDLYAFLQDRFMQPMGNA